MYSYLLVEKKFTLERMPSDPTKEKRFAYALYLDMLLLMRRISESIVRRGGDKPLSETRFVKRLSVDEQLQSLAARYRTQDFPFETDVQRLADEVKNSAIFKHYMTRRDESGARTDDNVWKEIFNLIIIPDATLNAKFATLPNYTLRAIDRMRDMMEQTFVNFMASQDDTHEAERVLAHSLDKSRELYLRLLMLPIELTQLQARNLEQNREKFLATDEELNPSLKFVDNGYIEAISRTETIAKLMEGGKLSWLAEEPLMMDQLLKVVTDSEIYTEYMQSEERSLQQDCELWRQLYKKVILPNPVFLEVLEDKSVFWNDDLDILGTFAVKTVKRVEQGLPDPVLSKFKDEDDSRFGYELTRLVLNNKEEYRAAINEALSGQAWEPERLAFMDVLIMETALAEILNFPQIPLNVSLNEYIEIAKSYSSNKSGMFVNGLLGSIVNKLKKEGKLLK